MARLEGKDADELLERLHQQNLDRRARALADARAEAEQRGKEPFDLDALEKVCDTTTEGRQAPVSQRRDRFEYLYYVEHPSLMTIAELAKLVEELNRG